MALMINIHKFLKMKFIVLFVDKATIWLEDQMSTQITNAYIFIIWITLLLYDAYSFIALFLYRNIGFN